MSESVVFARTLSEGSKHTHFKDLPVESLRGFTLTRSKSVLRRTCLALGLRRLWSSDYWPARPALG